MKFRWLATSLIFVCGAVSAQTQPQTQTQTQTQKQTPAVQTPTTSAATKSGAAAPTPDTPKETPIEEIAARVNGEIITSSDLLRAEADNAEEAKSICSDKKCTPEELHQSIEEAKKNALRGLIDTALLVQRAKDLELTVETEVVRKLDETRIENHLDSLEALQKAVESEGIDWEQFKDNLRNSFLAQKVVNQEVSSKIANSIAKQDVQKYYDEHKDEFTAPELVRIREILVSTEGKPEADWPALEKKADQLRERVLTNGEDFSDLAKHFSDGSTAHDGGELGQFERGQLDAKIEEAVFKLDRNQMTPVLHTSKGYLILQVEQRYEAGVQPLDKVENAVMERLAAAQMTPRLRDYFTTLRRDSFVEVRPGYVDTGATGTVDTSITEAKNPLDEPIGKLQRGPKKKKKFLIF